MGDIPHDHVPLSYMHEAFLFRTDRLLQQLHR